MLFDRFGQSNKFWKKNYKNCWNIQVWVLWRSSRGRPKSTSQGRLLNVKLGRPLDIILGRPRDVRLGRHRDVRLGRPQSNKQMRWLYFCLSDDAVTGDVESWRFWTTQTFFICRCCEWLHDEIEKLTSFGFILLDIGEAFVNNIPFVLHWGLSLSAKTLDISVESDPLPNNAVVVILVFPLLL